MSNMKIDALEVTIAALNFRVQQLEAALGIKSQNPIAETAQVAATPPSLPFHTRISSPPKPKPAPTTTPATPKPKLAPNTTPANPKPKPAPTTTPATSNPKTILYDANATKPMPNRAEPKHIKFIQTLHAAGISKEDIHQRTMDEFPELCKGGSEEVRKARVMNAVDLNTSIWADKYI